MEKSDRIHLLTAAFFTGVFLLVIWIVFVFDHPLSFNWREYGLKPRRVEGLVGIFSMHFLHGGLDHIASNSLSFALLNTIMFFFYRQIAFKVFVFVALLGGVMLWFWGGDGNHIGASLIIYGISSFLFFSGLFRSDERMLRVALFVAFYYGGIVWALLPIDPTVSWEGHLSGAVVGIVMAWIYRGQGPRRKIYQWEIEEELEQIELEKRRSEEENLNSTSEIDIKYWYSDSSEESDEQKKSPDEQG